MNSLITEYNGISVIDSLAIAEHTENQHHKVLELIEKYIETVSFERRPSIDSLGRKNTSIRIAYLNEEQATFLLTLLRNSEVVVRFKRRLVSAFFELREQIKTQNIEASNVGLSADQILQIGHSMKKLETENTQLKTKVIEDKPKVEYYDRVAKIDDWVQMDTVAKELNLGMGRNKLYEFLRYARIIMKGTTEPYQYYVDKGYFKVVEKPYTKNGEEYISRKTVVSPRGKAYILKVYKRITGRETESEGDMMALH